MQAPRLSMVASPDAKARRTKRTAAKAQPPKRSPRKGAAPSVAAAVPGAEEEEEEEEDQVLLDLSDGRADRLERALGGPRAHALRTLDVSRNRDTPDLLRPLPLFSVGPLDFPRGTTARDQPGTTSTEGLGGSAAVVCVVFERRHYWKFIVAFCEARSRKPCIPYCPRLPEWHASS